MCALSRQEERLLTRAAKVAYKGVKPGSNAMDVPEPFRTFITVYSAQPVIDNGGFQYLFECDWPGCPPYSEFARAYREIGATEVADWMEAAAAMFPFADSHLHREARILYLRQHCVKGDSPMGILSGDAIDASDRVFNLLTSYVRKHAASFGVG